MPLTALVWGCMACSCHAWQVHTSMEPVDLFFQGRGSHLVTSEESEPFGQQRNLNERESAEGRLNPLQVFGLLLLSSTPADAFQVSDAVLGRRFPKVSDSQIRAGLKALSMRTLDRLILDAGRRDLLSLAAASLVFNAAPTYADTSAISIAAQETALPTSAQETALTESAQKEIFKEVINDEFKYKVSYPASYTDATKPIKTHVHEFNVKNGSTVKLGLSVDSVRLDTIEEFGDLNQTTFKVLKVALERDGVKSVTLRSNDTITGDVSAGIPTYYLIEYSIVGERGNKVYTSKYCAVNRKLYALVAETKVDAFDSDENIRIIVKSIIDSFSVRLT